MRPRQLLPEVAGIAAGTKHMRTCTSARTHTVTLLPVGRTHTKIITEGQYSTFTLFCADSAAEADARAGSPAALGLGLRGPRTLSGDLNPAAPGGPGP